MDGPRLVDMCTVLTCTYNKTELVDYMLRSLRKCLGGDSGMPPVIVMNNGAELHSAKSPCPCKCVEIDNTGNRLVKVDGMCGSDRHANAIEYALGLVRTRFVVLVDDDILFKPEAAGILLGVPDYDAIGEIGWDVVKGDRLFPYFCAFNVEKMRRDGIHYWRRDASAMSNPKVDTGYSFREDIMAAGWTIKRIRLAAVIDHLKGASLRGVDSSKWLERNRRLWDVR